MSFSRSEMMVYQTDPVSFSLEDLIDLIDPQDTSEWATEVERVADIENL